ncbi:MAG: hypothetical protein ACE10B_05025 [Phycisphaerales bacterium]
MVSTRRGFEHPHDSPEKTVKSPAGGAESGALDAPDAPSRRDDPDLCSIIDAWPSLPKPVKAGIVAMVHAAEK